MDLFPAGLDSSLFPAILLGVLVTFAFTETLGWTFTGLVVPGYLASVAIVSGRAAALMGVEAAVTFGLMRFVSDGLARVGLTSRFFGRERFFLTLAIATAVRLATERALLPALASSSEVGAIALGAGDLSAHSIGLVLVPLMAHTLDKVGLVRGVLQLGTLCGITGLGVTLLLATTNLTLGEMSLTFEDIAFAIEHSPKAYVVLMCGALLAMRANVLFGWDFHGIIVPGLLAVAWFTPAKVALTLIEALAAYAVARGLLLLPRLRGAQVEGPRRLMLVFCADALLRLVIAVSIGTSVPLLRATDLFGFGYLLPTLLAVKIWGRHSAGRVLLPATQVSLGGFLAGNAVLVVFTHVGAWLTPIALAASGPPPVAVPFDRAVLVARAYVARDDERTRLLPAETARWRTALEDFAAGAPPDSAFAGLGETASFEVVPLAEGGVIVRERVTRLPGLRGAGVLVARATGQRIVVAVPRPLVGDALLAASDVARAVDARAVLVSGRRDPRADAASRMLSPAPWTLARRLLPNGGDTWLELVEDPDAPAGGILRVGAAVSDGAALARALGALLPALAVVHGSKSGAVLALRPATWTRLASTPAPCDPPPGPGAAGASGANANEALGAEGLTPPARDDELTLPERLAWDELVVRPVIAAARAGAATAPTACRAASVLGVRVETRRDDDGGRYLVVLSGTRPSATMLVRVGVGRATVVGAPRADAEPLTARAAYALYQALHARALVLGGGGGGAAKTYDVAQQALLDAEDRDAIALDVRGAGAEPAPLGDGAILTWGGVGGTPDETPAWIEGLLDAAARVGLPARVWDGAPDAVCCGDLHGVRRARRAALGSPRLATLYLSAAARTRRFGDADVGSARRLAAEWNVPVVEEPLGTAVAALRAHTRTCLDAAALFHQARRFAELRHVADLRALAATDAVRLAVDTTAGETFLLVGTRCHGAGALGIVSLRDPGEAEVSAVRLPAGVAPDAARLATLRAGGIVALWAEELAEQPPEESP